MNYAHVHLLINHFPLATLLFGFVILVISRIQKNEGATRMALGILVLGGLCGFAAHFTGDRAVDVIKNLPTYSREIVREHDAAAGFGLWATIITGAFAALGLFFSVRKHAIPRWCLILIMVVNVWALTVIARVNYLGGQIAHPETRPAAP